MGNYFILIEYFDSVITIINIIKCKLANGFCCAVGKIVPKYYYVPSHFVEQERNAPGTQARVSSSEGKILVNRQTRDNLFLWGQSVYIISQLLG